MRTATRGLSARGTLLTLAVLILTTALATGPSHAQKYLPTSDFSRAAAVPEPVRLNWVSGRSFQPSSTTGLVVPGGAPDEVRQLASNLKDAMRDLYGVNPELMVTDLIPEKNVILVGTLQDSSALGRFLPSASREQFGKHPNQGYALSVTTDRVVLVGGSAEGLRYGMQTLLQLVMPDPRAQTRVIPLMEIVDFPAVEMRMLLLPFGSYRQVSQMGAMRDLINVAQALHMNAVMLQVDNATMFDSAPGMARPGATPKDTLRAMVRYAREAGLEVIPLVYTLSKQTSLLCTTYPTLCLDKDTYDPSHPKLYDKLFAILDEVIEIFQPRYLHIGHDEVLALAKMPPADAQRLFLDDVLKIHEHLKSKNVGTMMWADMLIHSRDCPGQDNCRGSLAGVHAVLDSLPKDIVLVDAHYRQRSPDYHSMDYLLSEGFSVLGCVASDTFTVNSFSRYAAGRDGKVLGMAMALWDWSRYGGMSTPRKSLRHGAEAFWRGGIPPEDPTGENIPEVLRNNRY
ncbi:MAG: family 20 glycosylhydrolase [Candidatus Eisenbacteria bacterium]|nr:family 20 glycosylhydrolase [Candidatus Eisenbacteria bacterium]